MIDPISVGSMALGGVSAIKGMFDSHKAAKAYRAKQRQMRQDAENYYAKRLNQDYTQTAEMLSKWNDQLKAGEQQVADAKGTSAVMGNETLVDKTKANALNAQSALAAQQAAQGSVARQGIENQYRNEINDLDKAELAEISRQRQQSAQAGSNGLQVMGDAAANAMQQAYMKKPSTTYNMFISK